MTLHVAAVYFDYERGYCGFLLGADRRSGNYIPRKAETGEGRDEARSIDQQVVLIDKSFRSPNTIGFCSGEFRWPKGEHERLFRSLDNSFEGISEESDYSKHPTLTQANYAVLSVVQRNERKLELYGVYVKKAGESVEVKVRKHRELRRGPYKSVNDTAFWQDLTVQGTPKLLHDPGRKTWQEMIAHLLWTMRLQGKYAPERISAPFDMYAIDFDGIRKVA